MKLKNIDHGNEFDFGRVSEVYAAYRNIYPQNMYDKLIACGIGHDKQDIIDLGSGTGVIPLNMAYTGANFTSTDISENQVRYGRKLACDRNIRNIQFKVCSAEQTGFNDNSFDAALAVQCFHYFNADKAAAEIYRILRPGGRFCKVFMDWLPHEDEIISEMESLVLKYNTNWSGYGFDTYRYNYPNWANGRFVIETIHSYNTVIEFGKKAWLGRIISCRGVGAALPQVKVNDFVEEYSAMLKQYSEPLCLKHQIHIEVYRSTKEDTEYGTGS